MAKKKSHGLLESIGEAFSDVVDAGSVAATGSQLGVLELAAEEEISPAPAKRKKKAKAARKKKKAVAKSKKKAVVKSKKKAKKQKPKRK